MKRINIFEAKARLSECIEAAQSGEQVVICRRNRPVAELRPLGAARTTPRPIGGARGVEIPATFFDPLPDDILEVFYGAAPPRAAPKVAEGREPFGRKAPPHSRRKARP